MLTYGIETCAMKTENLHSLERAERMMMRWMCGVSLKDRRRNVDLYIVLYNYDAWGGQNWFKSELWFF